MPCYHPTRAAYEAPHPPRLWAPIADCNISIPCGKCIGCRTARATDWAHRCAHEAKQHEHNLFLTLTYNDESLPGQRHLRAEHLQRFIKRLRKNATSRNTELITTRPDGRSNGIRYFACGEYGENNDRPHYHALLFNLGCRDSRPVGKDLFESDTLTELWKENEQQFGLVKFGNATPAAASYIAQYSMKKIGAGDHDSDGVWRPAPFLRMSTKPAIGTLWLEKNYSDLTHGYLVADNKRNKIPRAYLKKLKASNPLLSEQIQYNKSKHLIQNPNQNTSERLIAGEIIHKRYKQLTESRNL